MEKRCFGAFLQQGHFSDRQTDGWTKGRTDRENNGGDVRRNGRTYGWTF